MGLWKIDLVSKGKRQDTMHCLMFFKEMQIRCKVVFCNPAPLVESCYQNTPLVFVSLINMAACQSQKFKTINMCTTV